MRRPPWQTACLCIAMWAVVIGVPWAVFRALVWITQLMEAAR